MSRAREVGEVVLGPDELRERVTEERQLVEEAANAMAAAKAAARMGVWRELLERSRAQVQEERERREQLRRVTRREAMELVRQLRHEAPDSGRATSRVAAQRIVEQETNREVKILTLLLMRPYGLTDQQIQHTLGMNPDTERPGRWKLSDRLGLVEDSGRTRETDAGNPATVWVAWRHARQQPELELGL